MARILTGWFLAGAAGFFLYAMVQIFPTLGDGRLDALGSNDNGCGYRLSEPSWRECNRSAELRKQAGTYLVEHERR